jgi:hypothetical protein
MLLLAATLVAWLAPSPATPALAAGPTLPRYGLEVELDYQRASLKVKQTTNWRNSTGQPLTAAVFQVPPAHLGAYQLLESSVQGQPVEASLNGTVLDVPLPAVLQPGASAEVGLSYGLTVPRRPGRMNAGPNVMALGSWFPLLAVHRGEWDRHQYTDVGDAFVSEVADFDLRLSSSVPLVVATTGRLVEESGTKFRVEARGVRDLALALSPSFVVAEVGAGEANVRGYSQSAERSRTLAEAAARYARWYGEQLGAYPYRNLAVVDVSLPASYGGLEYPGLILIADSLPVEASFRGSRLDLLIGHEVAHQWFYSLVGDDQVNDPWLDETFAEYLPYFYYRAANPDLFNTLWNSRQRGNECPANAGAPVDATVYDFPDDGPYYQVVYRGGARFLEQLRQTLGDEVFRAALAEVVSRYADKLASPRAVLDGFQQQTTTNLNPLIGCYFSYGAFDDPAPAVWRVELPGGALSGSADLFVGAEFPVTQVEVWLDSRRLYAGSNNALQLDLSDVEPGDYLLLVRILDHRGAQFERARRVTVAAR